MADVEFIGPIERHDVVVDGWRVPLLEATPLNGGRIALAVGYGAAVELTVEEADRVVPFIADCIAMAMGYTAHPGRAGDEPRRAHPMARVHLV